MFDVNESDSLSQILMDAFQYDDIELQFVAAELLYDMYNVEHRLLAHAEDSYLLTSSTDEETARQMTLYATFTDKDQLLRKMLKRQVINTEELLHVLDAFSSCCVSEKDETAANFCNQCLACSSGMHVHMETLS